MSFIAVKGFYCALTFMPKTTDNIILKTDGRKI